MRAASLLFFYQNQKKSFGIYLLVFVLVHHNARGPRLAGNGGLCMFEGNVEEWLMGPPEGTKPRCAMVVVYASGHIQRKCPSKWGSGRDSKSLFPLEIRRTHSVLTGHYRDGCDTPNICSSFFFIENENGHVYFVANWEKYFLIVLVPKHFFHEKVWVCQLSSLLE